MAGSGKMRYKQVVFLDTGALIAVHDENDSYWKEALEKLKRLRKSSPVFVTTDYVVDETYTGLLKKAGYGSVMEFDKTLSEGRWHIERMNEGRFVRAQEVFRRFNKDKEWSFTDCTSYVVMKELKIGTAFTFDQNFVQMGFKIL
ncbi:MAG: PIN domain-containing protein [Patescibacteria group bacterium]